MKIVKPSVELLWTTPDPEKQIEIAGRTCYKSENKITEDSAAEFVKKMKISGHHAMIEHATASFRIITDRGISHEVVRHRLASYAQESSRYCNYSKDKFGNEITVVEPTGLTEEQRKIWVWGCIQAETKYFEMLDAGCKAQVARAILPTCLKTEIVMTANFREFLHFIKLRGSMAAHPDIRPIAESIGFLLGRVSPSIFGGIDD